MDIFILEVVSNRLTVPVKIDGRQQQEENIGAIEPGSMYSTHVGHTRNYKCSISKKQMRSWVAWYYMETFILIVMSNLLTVPVKIDGRQQHEETRSLLKTGDHACARIKDKRGISSAVPSWKTCEAGWRCAL